MSERVCGFHCLDVAIHDECPHCTRIRIEERDGEIERLRAENELLRERVVELEASGES